MILDRVVAVCTATIVSDTQCPWYSSRIADTGRCPASGVWTQDTRRRPPDAGASLIRRRLRTLTWPPSSAPYELGEATTWKLSVAYGLGVTKRPYGACSDSTWSIFRWFYQIVKLAAHAQKVQFGL